MSRRDRKKNKDPLEIPHQVWVEMSNEEKMEYASLRLIGFSGYDGQGNAVVMIGMNTYKRIQAYRDSMISKYSGGKAYYDKQTEL